MVELGCLVRGTRRGGGFEIMGMGLSPVLEEVAVLGALGVDGGGGGGGSVCM
jgi:hypothetical protein